MVLRDVEKETHKHKVLWEKCLCTSNRVGRGATENLYISLFKNDQILMIFENPGVGVIVGGVQQ